ncbi:MAG: DNA polymerase ligase N-terminal domain-containing protein [Candidatus Korarchaeota archaeon]|nr:DNA polymerase ligase N-terminal domain-containing protein [Candidatus Korarchaeota archaeon]
MATRPGMPIFVVQEHHARRLHWDLRLEMDGVLKSWAIPKGIPTEPGVRRLAVQTEDHPLEYADFEGTIPEGYYGAGEVRIWDRGEYELLERTPDKITFVAMGERMRGKYALIRMRGSENWLLVKARG